LEHACCCIIDILAFGTSILSQDNRCAPYTLHPTGIKAACCGK
jgi:hypothetical protein